MTYTAGTEFVAMGMMIFFVAIAFGIISLTCALQPRKTQNYRKELTDLYVAGKIRQYADKDKIDINKEYAAYKIWNKKRKAEEKSHRDLDYNIESQMIDNLDEEQEKKT